MTDEEDGYYIAAWHISHKENKKMKKVFLIILIVALIMILNGCNFKTNVSGDIGIPSYVSHIEFWNGGTCIGEYDNATVATKIDTATKIIGANINFYRYEVTVNGETEVIVDSDALAIKYRK
jgi:hypothetical protein